MLYNLPGGSDERRSLPGGSYRRSPIFLQGIGRNMVFEGKGVLLMLLPSLKIGVNGITWAEFLGSKVLFPASDEIASSCCLAVFVRHTGDRPSSSQKCASCLHKENSYTIRHMPSTRLM